MCLVTPDGQRTMRTCLGAAAELATSAQLPAGWDAAPPPALLHCEGYVLYKPALAREAMAAAKRAGAAVSLDLASFEVVRNCRGALLDLLREGLVDVVFANEEEAAALAGAGAKPAAGAGGRPAALIEAAQALVLQHARLCVVSLGARGAVARAAGGGAGCAPARKVSVVDTIGAGDLFSAGFLYAYLRGCPLSTCCAAGCAAGAEAVQARGTALGDAAWARLREAVGELVSAAAADAAAADAGGARDGAPPRPLPCPAGRKRVPAGGLGLSPGVVERARPAMAMASSMSSSSSTQWLAFEADAA